VGDRRRGKEGKQTLWRRGGGPCGAHSRMCTGSGTFREKGVKVEAGGGITSSLTGKSLKEKKK